DAYTYFDKLMIYKKQCLEFLSRGGNLAWGIVPTTEISAIQAETAESLAAKFRAQVDELASTDLPAERIISQSLLTPSCGCGSLPEPMAERVLDMVSELSRIVTG
ncbi:MAG: hypothetical protein AAGU11_18975, partial [Syntrophobacteraceae bacterium]